jgi:carboxylesterase type B
MIIDQNVSMEMRDKIHQSKHAGLRTVRGQEAQGAAHASEIPFIVGTLSVWQQMRKYDESDQQYAPQMQEY